MEGYKAYNHGLVCRGKQYEVGQTYEEPKAEISKCGMHYCDNPADLIKRFHDCLLPNHDKIIATFKSVQKLAVKDPFLLKASGYKFFNTSEYTFEKLKADPENIKVNFENYLNGFSDNVMDIITKMDFYTQLDRMANAGLLYQVICDFCTEKADMNPEKISAVDMGYIFENLVQKFSESYDEEAGAHFTSRDIIYLMCDLLTDRMRMASEGQYYSAYESKTQNLIQINDCPLRGVA